jgi:hypothetical protein
MNPATVYAWVTTGAKYGACSDISIFISEMFKNRMCVFMAVGMNPELSIFVDITLFFFLLDQQSEY